MTDSERHFDERVYAELRRVARSYLAGSSARTLQPTALVHEAWLRLEKSDSEQGSRDHFLAVAAKAMRQVLVDSARSRGAEKRGGDRGRITLISQLDGVRDQTFDAVLLHDALVRLAELNERHATVVELRVFGGLSIPECAARLGVSHTTVETDWRIARVWLRRELG